jgi:hypothetical protein
MVLNHPWRPMLEQLGSLGQIRYPSSFVEVTDRKVVCIDPSDLRRLAAKAAQAPVRGAGTEDVRPGQVSVDQITLLFPSYNRLVGFSLDEIFVAGGWERHLDGFAELAGIERERETEADGMVMMA